MYSRLSSGGTNDDGSLTLFTPIYNQKIGKKTIITQTNTISTLKEGELAREVKNNSGLSAYSPFNSRNNMNTELGPYLECKSKTIFKIPNVMNNDKK